MEINLISGEIVDAAIEVHRVLGPGLLESVCEAALAQELRRRGFKVQTQVPLPVVYKVVDLNIGYRMDLVVENQVVVELKSIEKLEKVHPKQLLSYLKLSGHKVGLLINFNEALLKDGLKRLVNDL